MRNCTICNNSFFLHNNGYVIDGRDSMNRKESPCLSCSKDIREKCINELLKIIKENPISEDSILFFNKQNGNEKTGINKRRNKHAKKHC